MPAWTMLARFVGRWPVDETRPADRLPSPGGGNGAPGKGTRDTRAVPTDRTPGESREYPEIPGYEILGICGHGGMGVVYRARQLGANRLVALKMIRAVEHASPTSTSARRPLLKFVRILASSACG